MRLLLLFTLIFSVSVFASKSKNIKQYILANNESDFIILSDIESNEFNLFLSYVGTSFNHCGISLRMHSHSGEIKDLESKLLINNLKGTILHNRLVLEVKDKDIQTYGEFFKIQTVSGKTIKEEIEQLSNFYKAEVIVEILDCL